MLEGETVERPTSPFVELIGGRLEEWREGYVRMSITLEEHHTNPRGAMHGGVVTTLMDEALGGVIASVRGLETMFAAPHATVEMNAGFLSGARPGDRIVVGARGVRGGGAAGRRRDGRQGEDDVRDYGLESDVSTVYLGLGSNLGNREANLRAALRGLWRMGRVEAVSSLYETEPVGGPEQPPFLNAACRFETGLEPRPLLRFLQGLEHELGRRPRGGRGGARPPKPELPP